MAADELLKSVRITGPGEVYIGGELVPGAIAEDGIAIYPGDHRNLNRMVITFLVADVEIADVLDATH